MGEQKIPAGRAGEAPALELSDRLYALGLQLGRLKTGTPARLDGKSIDWAGLEMQPADEDPVPFSFLTEQITTPQIACDITTTTAATHDIIRANLAPLADVFRADRKRRAALLPVDRRQGRALRRPRRRTRFSSSPRGSTTITVYPNGISTSLPADVQEAFLKTIPGSSSVVIKRPGYAIEYDYVDPRELTPALEVKRLPGLYPRRPDQRHDGL